MFDNKKTVDTILSALGEQYASLKGADLDIVVCGGSALQALGLIERPTKDVDILAIINNLNEPILAEPLPMLLLQAVDKVARDFQLVKNWMNSGPTSAVTLGLPTGLLERAETRHYGSKLTVRFLSRFDQIHFKLYASADQNGAGKHYQDLLALKPTELEIEVAARWTMTHDPSEGFKQMLNLLIRELGYENVIQRI